MAVLAPAAVAVRPSEPTVTAAAITAPAATRLIEVFSMTRILSGFRYSTSPL
jgi:hypothetical protein